MSNKVILNKTNTLDIAKELQSCVLMYDYLGLARSHKWCSEMLYSIEDFIPNEDSLKIDFNEVINYYYYLKLFFFCKII